MSAADIVAARYPRLTRTVRGWIDEAVRVGEQTQFYGRTMISIGDALVHYKTETLRLIAQMGLGSGALAIIGGSVAVVGFLTMMTGALVAV
jgi:phospholipid/cholesterol/gamma-HCH transport system permease protein